MCWNGTCQIVSENEMERRFNRLMRKQKGFSLIELLIVVAIILIIAAIAIPNLVRARISANESSAAASERTIMTGMIAYASAYPALGFPAALTNLGPSGGGPCVPSSVTACLVDDVLASGTKTGYAFTAVGSQPLAGANSQYVTTAVPASLNITGTKAFCSAEDNVIRFTIPAGAAPSRVTCLTYVPIGD